MFQTTNQIYIYIYLYWGWFLLLALPNKISVETEQQCDVCFFFGVSLKSEKCCSQLFSVIAPGRVPSGNLT